MLLMGLFLDLDSPHSSTRTNRKGNLSHQWGETNRSIWSINNETERGCMLLSLRGEGGDTGDAGSLKGVVHFRKGCLSPEVGSPGR